MPAPQIHAELCARAFSSKASCLRCTSTCPTGALTVAAQPECSAACVACGACVSACPTGALEAPAVDDQALLNRLDPGWLAAGVALWSCRQAPTVTGALTLLCLGRVTENVLLGAVRSGARHLVLLTGDCAACPLSAAGAALTMTVDLTRALLDATRSRDARVHLGPQVPELLPRRRTTTGTPPLPPGSGRLPPLPRGDLGDAPLPLPMGEDAHRGQVVAARRARTLALLSDLGMPEQARLDLPPTAAWGDVAVTSACFGCHVCQRVCPTGALHRVEAEGRFELEFSPSRCVACGSCRDACLDHAITVTTVTHANLPDETVASFSVAPCPQCGRQVRRGRDCRFCAAPPTHPR